ncbi:hypothetical protein [Candidatus Neptunichlamydia sp. REUL1]|uniref:hypothetical protein n=1 Tax=Candidatus Neptunichlamydia sp. REUL1 TaxID=3064277 RepID=UPI00292D722A|nr:hypothetical protein [Candidatus Neptunochlamydia sp. REUL1]
MNKEDKKSVAMNFRNELEIFTTNVNELHKNGRLSTKQEFLEKIAEDVNRLYATSIQAQKAEDEEIEEIGLIIQNIFVQSIAIKHHKHVTILKAVETFEPGKGDDCDLSFIMREYVNHPASTKSFLTELELLTDDLDDALRHIA